MKHYVLYTDDHQIRGQAKLRNLAQARAFVRDNRQHLDRWAIYRTFVDGQEFHNSTDERYLVEHDDPRWHNRQDRERAFSVTRTHQGWSYTHYTTETRQVMAEWIVSAYGFLLEYGECLDGPAFGQRIARYYSLQELHNKAAYDFLTS